MDPRVTEKYEIEQEIGRGGYGVVYLARHKQLGNVKAIKELRTKTRVERERVKREVDILQQAQHPNVIKIDEIMESKDITYICMEYAEGGSLEKKLKGGIKREECLGITLDILKGVQALHARGIIHRDLKPDNILFDNEGKAKIGDFGIARTNRNISKLTKTGDVMGTIGYMAPEQLLGKKDEVDEQSDVYGVGIILYEMLTGKHPLRGANQIETVNRALSERYIVSLEASKVDNELREICYRAIKKSKAKRYKYAGEILEELSGYYSKNMNEKKGGFSSVYSKGVQHVLFGSVIGALVTAMSVTMLFTENSIGNRWEKQDKEYQRLLMSSSIDEGQILRLTQKEIQRNIYSKLQEKSKIDITETTLRGKELYGLGMIYYQGRGVEKNYEMAYKYFEEASRYRVINAYLKLGNMNLKGEGVQENEQKAVEYYENAAKENDSRGYYNLGLIYEKQEKLQELIYNMEKAASMNHHESIVFLVNFYEDLKDEKKVLYYLRKGVGIDNTFCLREMGMNVLSGKYGFKKNEQKGIEYIKKSIIYGDIKSARFFLHYRDLNKSIKQKIFEDVFKFIEKKQDKDDTYLTTLGYMYQHGYGTKKSYGKAKELYENAIRLGNNSAMNNLGTMYCEGDGVEKNCVKAKELFESAIELDNTSAMIHLGKMYEIGYGIQKNYQKARKLYERAAELENPVGMNNLGFLYHSGYGVKQNLTKAKELYEDAAKLGNPNGMHNLAFMYQNGYGVQKNLDQAKILYESAANLGNSDAMNNLGLMYYHGYGVTQDKQKAFNLFQKSASLGNQNGMNYVRGFK